MHWFAAQPLGVHVFSPYRAVIKPPLEVVVMTFLTFFGNRHLLMEKKNLKA